VWLDYLLIRVDLSYGAFPIPETNQ
jgi:hypothetical protein